MVPLVGSFTNGIQRFLSGKLALIGKLVLGGNIVIAWDTGHMACGVIANVFLLEWCFDVVYRLWVEIGAQNPHANIHEDNLRNEIVNYFKHLWIYEFMNLWIYKFMNLINKVYYNSQRNQSLFIFLMLL